MGVEMLSGAEKLDAGLKDRDHYRNRLPAWRYAPRQWLIPTVRWETPYLAGLQDRLRTPALDTYFSIAANLGTHTFFMIVLPMLFWCGYTKIGRAAVHILAAGVFFSGFLKDMWCLPRPLSPPLQRITMSQSAALEYGFPSTHSTNAVSVAVYALFLLNSSEFEIDSTWRICLQILVCCYATSITLGRVYCGMHGFMDVIVGSALGAALSAVQFFFGDAFDQYIHSESLQEPLVVILVILVLVRIHPEPADDCPCFDDSVAFAGTTIGIELGSWHFAKSNFAWTEPVLATVPYKLDSLGWSGTFVRIVIGVILIFLWRGAMKPTLLRLLPPVFRVSETWGLNLPRRYFVQASAYQRVPRQLRDDNVIPSVSEIPTLLSSIRHPRRSRSVSIGPQSEADAYETMACRENRRKAGIQNLLVATPKIEETLQTQDYFAVSTGHAISNRQQAMLPPTPALSATNLCQSLPGDELAVETPLTPVSDTGDLNARRSSQEQYQYEREKREMFSKLEKPRVRYDVEVVTKLIVYAGIAWIAVEGAPIIFELVGLGVKNEPG